MRHTAQKPVAAVASAACMTWCEHLCPRDAVCCSRASVLTGPSARGSPTKPDGLMLNRPSCAAANPRLKIFLPRVVHRMLFN